MRACVWTVRDLPTTSSSLFRVPRPRHRTTMRAAATRRQTALLAFEHHFLCFYETRTPACLSLFLRARLRREPGLNLPAHVPVQVRALRSVPPARWTRRGRRRRRRRAPAARLPTTRTKLAVTKLSGVRVRRLFRRRRRRRRSPPRDARARAASSFLCLRASRHPPSSRSRRLLGLSARKRPPPFGRGRAARARRGVPKVAESAPGKKSRVGSARVAATPETTELSTESSPSPGSGSRLRRASESRRCHAPRRISRSKSSVAPNSAASSRRREAKVLSPAKRGPGNDARAAPAPRRSRPRRRRGARLPRWRCPSSQGLEVLTADGVGPPPLGGRRLRGRVPARKQRTHGRAGRVARAIARARQRDGENEPRGRGARAEEV